MITITLPTTGRPERVANFFNSIDYKDDFRLKIGCRVVREDMPLRLINGDHKANVEVQEFDEDVVGVQNVLAASSSECSHILPISDDIVFHEGALSNAIEALDQYFPDGDGVIGFCTSNFKSSPYAFMLVGNTFFNKRLKRQLFHSSYKHFFADTELGRFAEKMNKFLLCEYAKINHYHPVAGFPKDETHVRNRKEKWEHDRRVFIERGNS